MIAIQHKQECCGCEACANICPKGCITMEPDQEGFLYPKVDMDRCVDCHLCETVCPFKDYEQPQNALGRCFAARTKNPDELGYTASGGVYTAIAHYIVGQGGAAVGAQVDGWVVRHSLVDHTNEVPRHSSSKYVQSRMGNIYKTVEEELKCGRRLVFSGTPCQVVALKKFLGRDYDNLLTIEVLCAGVASPMVFQQYMESIEKKMRGKVQYLNFKKKTFGYHSSTMYIKFDNGKVRNKSRLTDEMMHVFTSHIGDRQSCSECPIKGKARYSDMTIFDCWHYEKLTGKKDDDRGYTNVLLHSEKGLRTLLECREYLGIEEVNADDAIALDGNMVYGVTASHKNRDGFFRDLEAKGLSEAIKNNCKITLLDRIAEVAKGPLYRTGLLDMVKKLKR